MGCCCLTKKKERKKQTKLKPAVSIQQEKIEIDNSQSKEKVELVPQHVKKWLYQSPSKNQIEEQKERGESEKERDKQIDKSPPKSKRRQLLKHLFQQAKKSKEQNQTAHKHLIRTQTIDSSDTNSQKSRLTVSLQQAIKHLIKTNKQQLTSCSICTQIYTDSRPPMMLCMNQHTFCLQCIQDLWKKGYKKCPLDQNTYDIAKIQKNRFILSIVNKIQLEK